MTTTGRQFAIQRAVKASRLHPICRHLVLELATRINDEAGVILDKHQPSLTELTHDTGWSRTTLCRRLDDLEAAGWLARARPPKAKAAREHARTHYTIVIPGEQPAAASSAAAGPAAAAPDRYTQLVREVIQQRTGKAITAAHAAQVRDQILNANGQIRSPAAYLRKTLTSDPNPGRWLPPDRLPTVAERRAELDQLRRKEQLE